MSSPYKSAGSTAEPLRGNLYRVAIVGASTLKGKEVAEVLNDRNFPAVDVKLLDDDEALGQLETMGDEVTFIQSIRTEQFDHLDFAFFASDAEATKKNWKTAARGGSAIVDLSYALEEEAGAQVRAPWIEKQLGQAPAFELQPGPCVVAHPAATVLALLALRAQKAGKLTKMVATVMEPASERGQKGMDELHEQTVNLLSFQELPKIIYDTQIAFNMVARYGPNSSPALEAIERRILEHYEHIVGTSVMPPSLLLVQAPIFHGYAFSLYLEVEHAVELETFAEVLSGDHVAIAKGDDSPSNVNAAGQGDVLISLAGDEHQKNGLWIWAAADNLRVAATNAVECAETMTPTRPRGKIQ
jgi:aspartate-semialdehyde dehydrogenase